MFDANAKKHVLWKGPDFPMNDLDSVVLSINYIKASLESRLGIVEESPVEEELIQTSDTQSRNSKATSRISQYSNNPSEDFAVEATTIDTQA